jgi:predicted membrane GTPase involved in stress response
MHFQYPLETFARKRFLPRQIEFAHRARQAMHNTEDVRFESSEQGLQILTADEDTLVSVAQVLRELYGDFVEVRPPNVRLIPGNPAQQPVMSVRISTRRDYSGEVREELGRRGATILEECSRSRVFIVRGEAPLAGLLGLPRRLAALTDGTAVHWIRLSHYAPLPAGPEDSAA